MKVNNITQNSLNFGKVVYSKDAYTQEKLEKFKSNPNYDTFVKNMDELDKATGEDILKFSIEKDENDRCWVFGDKCSIKNDYYGAGAVRLKKDFEKIDANATEFIARIFSEHKSLFYKELKEQDYVKKSMKDSLSHECFNFSDDEQTQKALLLFNMVQADDFNKLLERTASVIGDNKITVTGKTDNIGSATLIFTDKTGDSKQVRLGTQRDSVYFRSNNNDSKYEISSNLSALNVYRQELEARRAKEKEAAKLEFQNSIKPFHEDFQNIKFADSAESDKVIYDLLKEKNGKSLLHEKFDWISKLAQIAGIELNVEGVIYGTITTSPHMLESVYIHRYPAIIIKDNNGNSTTLVHPSGLYRNYDRNNALNEMFNEKDIIKIPGLAYARSEQYKNWW